MATVKYKVPSQAASGADTFSDAIVGLQITNGTNQLTNANFEIDKSIPEKDSKTFISEPFSDYVTLDDIKEEVYTGITTSTYSKEKDNKIKFKHSKENGNISLFGSLKERLDVSVKNLIKKYPAGVYIDGTTPGRFSNYTADNIVYNPITNITEFTVEYSMFYNPLDIVFISPKSDILPQSYNDIRNFFSSYTKYIIEINSNIYHVTYFEEPDSNNLVLLNVDGDCFSGNTGYTQSYLIRPNNGIVEEFYNSLDEMESMLINRETYPKFTAFFNVMNDDNISTVESVTWPVSFDNWNIKINGLSFTQYINQLNKIGETIDNYKSNLINRFLVAPQLFEFDTDDKKMDSIFQIYGQSFDRVKRYIDNIANMRNISYDGIDNLPDVLLKNMSETLGLNTVRLFESMNMNQSVYERNNSTYDGVSIGYNLTEAEYEVYRRLLNNLVYLFKSKGTRKAIEFFLKFIGAADPMIIINEYVYKVDGALPTIDIESDILKALTGTKYTNIATYDPISVRYSITTITGSTSLYRDQYPVDETTGLPRKITSSDDSIFFEMGAGWYKKTLDHRSFDILDEENSNLTSRVKTIKTKSKPFTFGEDYFDFYRSLPGLNYGYNLIPEVDNTKVSVEDDEYESRKTLNRKNIDVFLSAGQAIDYDIYRKLPIFEKYIMEIDTSIKTVDEFDLIDYNGDNLSYIEPGINTTFSNLVENMTFQQYMDNLLNFYISNSNVVKYQKKYTILENVFYNYNNVDIFKAYEYNAVNNYINSISPNWDNLIEQFIPATTLWFGGNLIQNSSFTRNKYQHLRNRSTNNELFELSVEILSMGCDGDYYSITATTNDIFSQQYMDGSININVYDDTNTFITTISGQYTIPTGNVFIIGTDQGSYQGTDTYYFELVVVYNQITFKSEMFEYTGDCV